jgi:hypothetical protein
MVRKIVELITAESPAEAQRRALASDGPALVQELPAASSLIVNLVDVQTRLTAAAPAHPYAATIEATFAEDSAAADAANTWESLFPSGKGRHRYLTGERIQLDYERTWPLGERSPGVKAIYLVRRPEGVSNEQATRGWREHAGTARKHHEGMWKYVQNGVIHPLTVNSPLIHGIAELHFPTLEDLEERMYDSPAGREAIQREANQLVGEAIPLYCSEYVLHG